MAKLGHVFKKIDKNNFQQDLINFFEFDNDISGSNGIEYTSKEALDAGYKSTAEFIVKQVIDSHGETKKAIENAINSAIGNDGYYAEIKLEVEELDDRYYVSLAYTH